MRLRPELLLPLFLLLLSFGTVRASHIVGGDITYDCVGYDAATNTNRYRITMKIYRNCNRFAMDVFSDPAPVTIYREAIFNRWDSVTHIDVPLGAVINIPPDDNPCLKLPPDICVEEGSYVFFADLPVVDATYVVAFQRCCRNATINNILEPDRTGATYSVQISAKSQRVCNDSPVFNEFPPIVICANEPIDFDHSATDPEGDQIVYEFCAALEGGGVLGAFEFGDPESCDGFRPDPACPPPYRPVRYVLPTFTSSNPMGIDPPITIDPNTGLITGIPENLGQFVVGVCVKEFRNGELLSTIQRDFQFNVANCEPLVDARIQTERQISDNAYVITACGEFDVLIENASIQRSNITDFFWLFDLDGTELRVDTWDAQVSFPDTGLYQGTLFLNPGSNCADTAFVTVQVFPDITADYSFSYDTCVAGPVEFRDLSTTEGDNVIVSWNWAYGNLTASEEQNPSIRLPNAGEYDMRLRVEDDNGCIDEKVEPITWFPAPEIIVVEPSTFIGCTPANIRFNNLTNPITDDYDILWDFGDGGTSSEISPTYTYEEPGVYDVSLSLISPLGCTAEESWDNWITVFPTPMADFTFSPDRPSNFNPEVRFFDQSTGAFSWLWDFSGESRSTLQNPTYVYRDTGVQVATLIVTHEQGCTDTISKLIDVEPQIRYFMPNAFTPNDDNLNDGFKGKGFFNGIRDFSMSIYNRWGELIFETSDPDEGWNGRKFNSGRMSQVGVYVYLVRFEDPRGKLIQLEGVA
ncbi:MAG: PKD domain-containing protein, partial [Bacteroidota bacterium]